MKKRLYFFTTIFIILIFITLIFYRSNELKEIVHFSSNLFLTNIFPSLFPMFVLSNILVELNVPFLLGKYFNKITYKIFKVSGASSFIFFMSMISGFPSSAKYINDLLDKKLISIKESQKVLLFTFFSNPLFIVNTIGNMFFNSIYIGLLIWISHVLGNIIIGIVFRNYNVSYSSTYSLIDKSNSSLFNILNNSIKNSIDILLTIFGIVTFSLIITNMIFSFPNSLLSIFSAGLIEMTSGLKYLSLSSLDINIKLVLTGFFISFGGLSVHFQIMSILNKKKVKYLPFLLARTLHGVITSIVLVILFYLIKEYAILNP